MTSAHLGSSRAQKGSRRPTYGISRSVRASHSPLRRALCLEGSAAEQRRAPARSWEAAMVRSPGRSRRVEGVVAFSSGDKNGPMSEINVTPLVDVMLVLLIIFMVTAPLMQQGVKVDLPQAAAEPV